MKATFIRELPMTAADAEQCLVKLGEQFYCVSSVTVLGTPETLVFPADETGKVTSWGEVAGGKHVSREEAIADLEASDAV
jgi:hypothetical protein